MEGDKALEDPNGRREKTTNRQENLEEEKILEVGKTDSKAQGGKKEVTSKKKSSAVSADRDSKVTGKKLW